MDEAASIPLKTLKWWRELVDLNPADLAPRMDAYLAAAAIQCNEARAQIAASEEIRKTSAMSYAKRLEELREERHICEDSRLELLRQIAAKDAALREALPCVDDPDVYYVIEKALAALKDTGGRDG